MVFGKFVIIFIKINLLQFKLGLQGKQTLDIQLHKFKIMDLNLLLNKIKPLNSILLQFGLFTQSDFLFDICQLLTPRHKLVQNLLVMRSLLLFPEAKVVNHLILEINIHIYEAFYQPTCLYIFSLRQSIYKCLNFQSELIEKTIHFVDSLLRSKQNFIFWVLGRNEFKQARIAGGFISSSSLISNLYQSGPLFIFWGL